MYQFYYLYYFLYFYPLVYYAFILYRFVEYYSFTKKVCGLFIKTFHKAFEQVKQTDETDEIEEIYDLILMTEPNETVTIDDTNYVSYYSGEMSEIKEEWY